VGLDGWLNDRGYLSLKEPHGLAVQHLRELVSHNQLRFSFDPELCSLCDRRVTVCAYQARRLTPERQMLLDEAACRACGLCVSVCTTGALKATAS